MYVTIIKRQFAAQNRPILIVDESVEGDVRVGGRVAIRNGMRICHDGQRFFGDGVSVFLVHKRDGVVFAEIGTYDVVTTDVAQLGYSTSQTVQARIAVYDSALFGGCFKCNLRFAVDRALRYDGDDDLFGRNGQYAGVKGNGVVFARIARRRNDIGVIRVGDVTELFVRVSKDKLAAQNRPILIVDEAVEGHVGIGRHVAIGDGMRVRGHGQRFLGDGVRAFAAHKGDRVIVAKVATHDVVTTHRAQLVDRAGEAVYTFIAVNDCAILGSRLECDLLVAIDRSLGNDGRRNGFGCDHVLKRIILGQRVVAADVGDMRDCGMGTGIGLSALHGQFDRVFAKQSADRCCRAMNVAVIDEVVRRPLYTECVRTDRKRQDHIVEPGVLDADFDVVVSRIDGRLTRVAAAHVIDIIGGPFGARDTVNDFQSTAEPSLGTESIGFAGIITALHRGRPIVLVVGQVAPLQLAGRNESAVNDLVRKGVHVHGYALKAYNCSECDLAYRGMRLRTAVVDRPIVIV